MNFQALKIALCGIFLAVTLLIAGAPLAASAAGHAHSGVYVETAAKFSADTPSKISVSKISVTVAQSRGVIDHSRAPVQPGIFQPSYQMHFMRPGLAKATVSFRLPDNSVAAVESRCDGVVPRPTSFQSSFLVENTRAPRAPPRLIAA